MTTLKSAARAGQDCDRSTPAAAVSEMRPVQSVSYVPGPYQQIPTPSPTKKRPPAGCLGGNTNTINNLQKIPMYHSVNFTREKHAVFARKRPQTATFLPISAWFWLNSIAGVLMHISFWTSGNGCS
jgi:hypothetical protein